MALFSASISATLSPLQPSLLSNRKAFSSSNFVRLSWGSGLGKPLLRLKRGSSRFLYSQRPPVIKVEAKKQKFSSLDDLLANSDKPVLVDFYATWCGPCQYMVLVLNEVATALKDKITVVKIDTEKYPMLADRYKVEGLPTFIIFKDGKPCDRFEGALPANQLIPRIENALKVST